MFGVTDVLLLLVSTISVLYALVKYKHSYWARKNVPYLKPHTVFGSIKRMCTMETTAAEALQDIYNDKDFQNEPCVGIYIFNTPTLLIREPELIKAILVKDFYKFSDRYSYSSRFDPLSFYNLFFTKNPMWKELRNKLTPVFTSGKLKQICVLANEIGAKLDEHLTGLSKDTKTNSCVTEIKNVCALFTTDVIASVAFGLEANCLKNPESDFRRFGRKVFEFNTWQSINWSLLFFLPHLVKVFRAKLFPPEVTKFLRGIVNYSIRNRIKADKRRNDLIDVLVNFMKTAESDDTHFAKDNDVLVAQAALFYTAGFETSSSTMAFTLYELSQHPDIQERLRNEIKEALQKTDGEVTYDLLNEMPYLQMVIQEVLRLFPPLPFLDRQCTLPVGEESYSLKPYSDFTVPHGMPIYIPIYALQRDPKYFSNPTQFDPERFSPENKANIVPSTYMPFGSGPHNCIGERLGLMQVKMGLVHFLKNRYVTPCEKTPKNIKLYPKALIIQAEGGIHLNIVTDPLLKT